jgi:glycosyltransferase involved in cell wall biosynthesis
MLDLLPELTHEFDVLIIDDGSTDATCEVAHDLATQFPQVRFHRQSRRRGAEAALRDGLTRTQSDVVLGHNGEPAIDAAEIARLWRRETPKIAARTIARENGINNFRLLRRDVAEDDGVFRSVRRIERRPVATPDTARPPTTTRRPNFLRRLKDFAVGE